MRLATFKNRRNLIGATVLTVFVSQSEFCMPPAFAEKSTSGTPHDGAVILEETTSEMDPKLTWKVLQRAFERVRQGRLDEADRWLMYAMQNASSDPLLEVLEDSEHLANCLSGGSANNSPLSAQNCDVRILQALIQARIGSPRMAIVSLRSVEKSCPSYHSMNQVKSRIRALDLIINPPARIYAYEPRELSPKEFQEIIERIAREKIALAENQKTLNQALLEAKKEQLEKFSRWRANRFPLKVFIPIDEHCAEIPGYIAGDRNLLIESFQLWQKTMKERIKFIFVDSEAEADITCEWVDHPNKLGTEAKDAVGTCSATCENSFSIVHARIRILTFSGKDAAPNGAGFRGKYLRNVALHEIGHALGLDHLMNEKSIMYFQVHHPLLETLAADDAGAMHAKLNIASASERIWTDEGTIRHLVTNVESQLKAAKDLERFNLWDQAFSFYDDAFKYRPSDKIIRQNICRTANNAGRVALKKGRTAEAIKYLSRGRELMSKETPLELRQQILEKLCQAYEASNQQTDAAEVQAVLQSGNF